MEEPLEQYSNEHAFSDGTPFSDHGFLYEWDILQPDYTNQGAFKCAKLKSNGKIASDQCDSELNALCKIEECEDASSESERSRVKLSVFALFMACSVLKTFFALDRPAF